MRCVPVGETPKVFAFEQEHPLGVGGQGVVRGLEKCLVASRVQGGQLTCQQGVGEVSRVDAVRVM